MLEVYFGNNTIEVRRQAFAAVEKRQAAGATVEYLDSDNFVTGVLADSAGGASLFGGENLFVIDTPSQNKDFYAELVDSLDLLAESPNQFVLLESSLLAPEKKKLSKYAVVLNEYKADAATRFNTFALADALARKDKKSLWLLLSEARFSGIALEELVGVLWWQLKTLRLAGLTHSASEAGLKDFPYSKAKRALSKFKESELETLSRTLLSLQHDSRLGKCELDVALERWVLTI